MDLAFLVLVDARLDPLVRLVVLDVEVGIERVVLDDDADLDIDAGLEPELAVAEPPRTLGHGDARREGTPR